MHAWIRCAIPFALTATLGAAQASTDRERRAGDVLSLALPVGVLAAEAWRGDGEGAWQLVQTFALSTGLTELLKKHTGVTRPDGSDDQSFPSGHAARAFSAAAYVHQRHGWDAAWPLVAVATYVGHTRVQAKRHRWSEVAVAAGLSYGIARWRVTPVGGTVAVLPQEGGGVMLSLHLPL
jgi:membrane-associated phospholipid phosphatase